MILHINIKKELTPLEKTVIESYLTKLADNVTKDNLAFLAELSTKPDVNKRLESKKQLIKTFF